MPDTRLLLTKGELDDVVGVFQLRTSRSAPRALPFHPTASWPAATVLVGQSHLKTGVVFDVNIMIAELPLSEGARAFMTCGAESGGREQKAFPGEASLLRLLQPPPPASPLTPVFIPSWRRKTLRPRTRKSSSFATSANTIWGQLVY